MVNDENGDLGLTPSQYRNKINLTRSHVEKERIALDVLDYAAELDRLSDSSMVSGEQEEVLIDTVERAVDAADAIWPDDDGLPNLDQLIDQSDAVMADDVPFDDE